MKKATLFMLLSVAMLIFGCTKEEPQDQNLEGNPLKLNNFALCDGSQVQDGQLSYVIYNNFEDWKAGANQFESGSSSFPVELIIPELEDGKTYYYDLTVNGHDNWFGGNVLAKSESNFSFTYSETGNNTMVPRLYDGGTDLLGQYALTDIISAGVSTWSNAESCVKDNFIAITKDFSMTISEGSEVCPGSTADASYEFYYANCMSGDDDMLEAFESDWLNEAGHQAIMFDIESGSSRLTLTMEENGGTMDYIFVRQ